MIIILILTFLIIGFSIQGIYAQEEGMTGEEAKALKESLERLEKEPKQPGIRGDLLLAIIIPLAIIGIVITAIIRMKKSR